MNVAYRPENYAAHVNAMWLSSPVIFVYRPANSIANVIKVEKHIK